MRYKSIADLAADTRANLFKVPADVDLIVGVPRSGLLAASLLGLLLNRKFCDVAAFVENRRLEAGTRTVGGPELVVPQDARRVLVMDDSVGTGAAMRTVREVVGAASPGARVLYGAAYVAPSATSLVDLFFEVVPLPRIFEWNLFHRGEMERFCVDIDGVLCPDPTDGENDDGRRYREFVLQATPLVRPSQRIGHLVTSRLERYRAETERWLDQAGIAYEHLHMLDLPSAMERRRRRVHASYKADVYSRLPDALLFIESDTAQANEIARLSGRPVLDYGRQFLVQPPYNAAWASSQARSLPRRIARRLRTLWG
jgi:uncharacterized HAD superfamily protein/adenine/guanine phosphoribosyltransferase-like PRPP-binding protein